MLLSAFWMQSLRERCDEFRQLALPSSDVPGGVVETERLLARLQASLAQQIALPKPINQRRRQPVRIKLHPVFAHEAGNGSGMVTFH